MSFDVVPTDDRADWLAKRRTGVGASDTAAILGVSPYSTPYQVWLSKLVDIPEETDDEAMWWGRTLEAVILDRWADENDITYKLRDTLLRSDAFPWMMATPDAVTSDGIPVDAKNDGGWGWDEVPEHYRIQVQHQMTVCDEVDHGFLAVLHRGKHLETYRVDHDDILADRIIRTTKEFWALVESETPPPVEAEDNALLASLWPRDTIKAVEVPEEMAVELAAARAAYAEAKQARALAEVRIKEAMGDAAEAVVGQALIATWKSQTSRRIDAKALRRDHPDIADEYTTVSESRVFRARDMETSP